MEDNLIELLDTFGFPVIRQGSLTADTPYPDNFFTFWSNDSADGGHYDNQSVSNIYDFDVNFYSNSPDITYSKMRDAITLLRSNGYIVSGDGHDIASDEDTHTGRGVNVLFLNTL